MSDSPFGSEPDAGATRLDQRLAALPREVQPPAALWSGIRYAIGNAPTSESVAQPRPKQTLPDQPLPDLPLPYEYRQDRESVWVACLSGVAATLTFVVILFANQQATSPQPASQETLRSSSALSEPAGFAAVSAFEVEGMDSRELMRIRANLHLSLKLALDELAPETRETVVESLARIDKARTEIDEALRDAPANRLLKQMLLASYTQEIRLLNDFTIMARSAPQRTQL